MREILFRGKRADNGEWVEGYYCYGKYYLDARPMAVILPTDISFFPHSEISEWHEVIPVSVGQYTGLLDRKEMKIFEHDILESRASENPEDWKRWICVYHGGGFIIIREYIECESKNWEQHLLSGKEINLYGLEVIGNVHDNPELMIEEGVTE